MAQSVAAWRLCHLTRPQKTDHPLVQEASFPYLDSLLKAEGEVFQYEKGFYHGKVCIFDEKRAHLGTSNFDRRSFFLNSEINCLTSDPSLVKTITTQFNEDAKASRALTLNLLHEDPQPFKRKVASWMAGLL
ncbi:hypothetical protein G4V62_06975 [Bacillaceae bacterium SIJ1]|nr:hypothetical protein [Litoribacterium kuwaitense]